MPRLIGPLEFLLALGGIGTVGFVLATFWHRQQRYLSALAALTAFPVSVWSGSIARQIVFELQTDGVVSSQMDSCSVVLMPIVVVALSVVLVILADVYAALGMLDDMRRPPAQLSMKAISRNQLFAVVVFFGLGVWFGFTHWVDWRVNQPCL